MSGAEALERYVEAWRVAARDVIDLLRSLQPNDWEKPTDLEGWNVRYVAAHLAHLESELAGMPQQHVDVPDAAHIKGLMGHFTEMGPLARQTWTAEEVVDQLEEAVEIRDRTLSDHLPDDPAATGPSFAALIGWSWETLLSNRPFDIWMHSQDIRRAVRRPGGLEGAAAEHVADVFAKSLPYVVAKRAGAAPGTTVVLEVTGPSARTVAVTVGDDGRGVPLHPVPDHPTVRLTVDFESWILLAGGRRSADMVDVTVTGDEDLAARILDQLAVTP